MSENSLGKDEKAMVWQIGCNFVINNARTFQVCTHIQGICTTELTYTLIAISVQ